LKRSQNTRVSSATSRDGGAAVGIDGRVLAQRNRVSVGVMPREGFSCKRFGILVKGKPDVIVRDGQSDLAMMWRNHVSTHDLDEDMRLSAHTDDVSTIRVARVERSGDISFIKK
jgi:hypothetical protein